MSKEVWKLVGKSYDGYKVSNLGRVVDGNNKLVKPVIDEDTGRKYVELELVGQNLTKRLPLASLVAIKFIPNPDKYKRLIFLDGDKNNIVATNLQWVGEENWVCLLGKFRGFMLSDLGVLKCSTSGKRYVHRNLTTTLQVYNKNTKKVMSVSLAKLVAQAFLINWNNSRTAYIKDPNLATPYAVNNVEWGAPRKVKYSSNNESIKQVLELIVKRKKPEYIVQELNLGNRARINYILSRYGYPSKVKEVLALYRFHKWSGTLDLFFSGELFTENVELAEGEVKALIPGCESYFLTNMGRIIVQVGVRKERLLTHRAKSVAPHFRTFSVRDSNGKATSKTVHLLVAELFLTNPNNYTKVIYLNKDFSDCRSCNIKWVDNETYRLWRKSLTDKEIERNAPKCITSCSSK